MIKRPKILILDEATSALDAKSEGLVQDALEKLQAGRTTLVIAHRLSTIRSADQILVLDRDDPHSPARIVQRGTHDELIGQTGRYADLWAQRARAASWRADRRTTLGTAAPSVTSASS